MPAVTVADILLLPRITEPDPAAARDRGVQRVTTAPSAHGLIRQPPGSASG